MVEITNSAVAHRSAMREIIARGAPPVPASRDGKACAPLATVAESQWRALTERAIEPNGYYLADWELAVNASARGRSGVSVLKAWSEPSFAQADAPRLIGLAPVVSMWRAYKIPLPALVSADPYGTLCTPLLDRDVAEDAVVKLMQQARRAGAHALVLRDASLDGAAMKAVDAVLRGDGLRPTLLQSHMRAVLDATRDAEESLRDALGAKKIKELRRQRNRLAEHGAIRFDVARKPQEIAKAVETFLALEASGWKGERGTALMQDAGDAAFIRRATSGLAERGQCEIVSLYAGDTPVAAAVVLRHQDRAFYFKLGVDERFAKFSPGVQLTLDLTRHLCADPTIALADSTAVADHPMINPIWRGRLAIGDVLIPLRRNDPAVALIQAAMFMRQTIREPARRLVQFIRKRQEKPS
ncbi:MAG TPA: GNAT family N-acetyltransferase [Bradyrhizobium sp.]|nr:GNAT family N-acetyltransferase [Bradyrhizobium sp.]